MEANNVSNPIPSISFPETSIVTHANQPEQSRRRRRLNASSTSSVSMSSSTSSYDPTEENDSLEVCNSVTETVIASENSNNQNTPSLSVNAKEKTPYSETKRSGIVSRKWSCVLNYDLNHCRVLLKWTTRKATWEDPTEVLTTTKGCDVVLNFLSEQKELLLSHDVRNIQQLNKMIEKIEDRRLALDIMENEENSPVEPDQLAFCCYDCHCPEENKTDCYITCGININVWHNHCCHKIFGVWDDKNWLSPIGDAVDLAMAKMEESSSKYDPNFASPTDVIYTEKDLLRHLAEAKRRESEATNDLYREDPVSRLATDERYIEFCKLFNNETTREQFRRRSAVVLDMFCGIGGGLVALKRLGIAIDTVIHVDHDKVARHVVRFNHDYLYNSNVPHDGICHVFDYSTFEQVERDLDSLMDRFAPIDIIIGGPPCSDYSGANAYREGIHGAQGQYLPKFASLISKVRQHKKQLARPVFFLCENVDFYEYRNKEVVSRAFEINEICLDARDFSPCRRKRFFYTSIPVDSVDFDGVASESLPAFCLSDGWIMPAQAVSADSTSNKANVLFLKANTFMASESRIDDERMLKVKPLPEGRRYLRGILDVNEREKMLGLPENYVKHAVDTLFSALSDAFFLEIRSEDEKWMHKLDGKYHHFAGDQYKFRPIPEYPYAELLMTPPKASQSSNFFTKDGYSKHLLGNGFSIPVVEHLLRPLQRIFASRAYEGYNYRFPWPPHIFEENNSRQDESGGESDSDESVIHGQF